jgi:hypothetical protein
MLPKFHIVTGLIFSIAFYILFPSINVGEAGIIFLASFLIDFDHYAYYVVKEKDFNLKNAYRWFKKRSKLFSTLSKARKNKIPRTFSFLHGLEWVFLFFLSGKIFSPVFFFIAIGMLFHLILDCIDSYIILRRIRKISVIYDYFYIRNKKIPLNKL